MTDLRDASRRRTKLVCTLGPATEGRVESLVAAGMDVARINFSHGTAATHVAAARSVREAAGEPIAIMVDLAGPKIRLGELVDGSVDLEPGRPFLLRTATGADPLGDIEGASVSYPRLPIDVRVGDPILLADGAAQLRVVTIEDDGVHTEVVRGGTVRDRAGVAIPTERLSSPALTERDRADAPRATELGADWIAQSFVRRADDVRTLRSVLGRDGPPIVAKIETRPAVDNIDEILAVADAVMIARGDLGVELPYEQVPIVQKQLVRRALDLGVPTIVATQMLESMTNAPRPTRAEASDVANAVFDGADAIMLSGVTAIGAFPLLAAEAAVLIATLCETDGAAYLAAGMSLPPGTDTGALAYAAVALTGAHPGIEAIACYTRTGVTARVLASMRPKVPIVAFTPDPTSAARLALSHGVVARPCAVLDATADRIGALGRLLDATGLIRSGATVVLVTSTATPGSGPTLVGIHRVGEPG